MYWGNLIEFIVNSLLARVVSNGVKHQVEPCFIVDCVQSMYLVFIEWSMWEIFKPIIFLLFYAMFLLSVTFYGGFYYVSLFMYLYLILLRVSHYLFSVAVLVIQEYRWSIKLGSNKKNLECVSFDKFFCNAFWLIAIIHSVIGQ